MKRIFLSLVTILLFCGVISAQNLHWTYNLDWNNGQQPESSTSIQARVHLDGEELASNDYEIAAFVGDVCRISSPLRNFSVMPDVYWAWYNIPFQTSGETVTFKLYQYSTETEYLICTNTLVLGEEVVGTIDDPYIIDFYSPITKDIDGYSDNIENPDGGYYLIASPIGQV